MNINNLLGTGLVLLIFWGAIILLITIIYVKFITCIVTNTVLDIIEKRKAGRY